MHPLNACLLPDPDPCKSKLQHHCKPSRLPNIYEVRSTLCKVGTIQIMQPSCMPWLHPAILTGRPRRCHFCLTLLETSHSLVVHFLPLGRHSTEGHHTGQVPQQRRTLFTIKGFHTMATLDPFHYLNSRTEDLGSLNALRTSDFRLKTT